MAERQHQWADPAKRGPGADVSTDALFSLLGDDVEIMAKVRLLANMVLESAFMTMRSGTVAERTALTKSLMPSLVKMLASRDQGGVAELRARMTAMFEAMGGGKVVAPDSTNAPVPPPPPPIE